MISGTDAASAVSPARCKAIPHTDQATAANAPFFLFISFLFLLLAIFLFTSLSLPFYSLVMSNPARCRDKFTGLPGGHQASLDTYMTITPAAGIHQPCVCLLTGDTTIHSHTACASADTDERRAPALWREMAAPAILRQSLQLPADLPRRGDSSRCRTASWMWREPRLTCCQQRPRRDSTHQPIDLCVMSPL